MTNSKQEPLVGRDGEVREITTKDLKFAKRGRPAMPDTQKKRRMNVMLDPDVVDALKATGENASKKINDLLRKDLGLKAA